MNLLAYILKANLFLIVFYGFYFLFFRKETFHKANRYFLVVGAIVALTLPFFKSTAIQNTQVVPTEIQDVAYEWYFESEDMVVSPAIETYTYFDVFKFLYLLGLIVAIGIFLLRFIKTFIWFNSNRNTPGTAFSFFGKIFIDHNLEQKPVVFKHENIHVEQRHFIDLIFFEILQIVFWFNPVVYFYKKSICIIHEFLADEEASKIAQDKIAYASLLVSKQFSIQPATVFTQHFFNHSTLKSRIIMLSKNPSKKTAFLKFGFLAPAFFVMLAISSFTVVSDNKFEKLYNNLNNDISEKPLKDLVFPKPTKAPVNEEVSVLRNVETISMSKGDALNFLPNNNYEGIEDLNFPTPKEDTFPKGNTNKQIFTKAEQIPEFNGGQAELYKWLARNIKYPLEAKNNKIEGRVYVKLVIEADGEIGEVEVMKGIGYGCDEEAARVLKAMPKWKPAMQNGYPVAIYYNMPISFKLSNKNLKSDSNYKIEQNKKLETENLQDKNKGLGQVQSKNLLHDDTKPVEKQNLLRNDKEAKEEYFFSKTKNNQITLNGTTAKPLVFVDGKELFLGMDGLSSVKPETIESISVIKEQSKLQLYGPRAKDGVILIKTKTNFIKTDEKK
jgi:TonB family protein